MSVVHTSVTTAAPPVLRVLLVDDTPDIRFLLRLALDQDGGFVVVGEAQDGLEALEMAGGARPDLVVLDLSMPRMDGLTVLPQLRRTCPRASILVLSGFDGTVLAPRALAAGADGYLRKGASPQEIVGRARELLGLHEPAASAEHPSAEHVSAEHASADGTEAREPRWSLPHQLLDSAPFGLLAVTVGRHDDLDLWVRSANDVARAVLGFLETALPARLSDISPALDDMVRSGGDGVEGSAVQDPHSFGAPLGDRDDLTVRLHRDGREVTVVLMPIASATETTLLRRAIASVAHEMSNPVTILVGATQALASGRGRHTSDVEDRLFSAIDRQARQLERATADLLTAAARHSGTFDVHVGPVRLAPVLDGCVAAQPQLAHVRVQCRADLWVCADTGRLEQMVVNLLSNALKYGAEPVTVTVSSTPETVSVHVSDAGIGVSPAFVPKLFDEFTREAGQGVHGTGLGLHVVRSLAEAQRGQVSYTRTDDERSRFTISLPRTAVAQRRSTDDDPDD